MPVHSVVRSQASLCATTFACRAVASAVLMALAAAAPTVGRAQQGQQQGAAVSFDIPAGELDGALSRFGLQSGLLVSANSALTAGKRSTAVQGTFSPAQALDLLLRGTQLSAIAQADGGYVLIQAPAAGAAAMAPIRVEGQLDSELTAGSGSYAGGYLSFGKGQTVRELPQSVSVMTQQRIQDQALNTLEGLFRQTTGLTVPGGGVNGTAETLYSRGFAVTSMQIDGANIDRYYDGFFTPNLAMYDSVQVVRGADGLFGGTGSPGGSVNLVRKRATSQPQLAVDVTVARWNRYEVEVDAGGPLALQGRLRGRAVVSHQDREFFFDTADARNTLVYGVVDWDVSDSTRLSLGGSYERQRDTPWRLGLPRAASGADLHLPRNTALATAWSERSRDEYEAFVQLEQRLGRDWQLRVQGNYRDSDGDTRLGNFVGAIDPASGAGLIANDSSPLWYSTKTTVDISMQGGVPLFGRRHQLLVGWDWRDIDWTEDLFSSNMVSTPGAYNIYQFDAAAIARPTQWWLRRSYPDYGDKQSGLYARFNASVTDRLTAIIGGRYSDYEYVSPYYLYNQDGSIAAHSVSRYSESGIFTPYAGLVYDIGERWTAYGSVTEIHQSQANRLHGPLPGSALAAVEGRNYELGIKSEWQEGRLLGSAALYRIERTGEAVRDPGYPSNSTSEGLNCCWVARGEVVSEGVELELSGELGAGWQLTSGYTYNRNENRESDVVYSSITPRHLFKLWSTYRLPQRWSRWSVGAGVTAQSANYVRGTAATFNPTSGVYDGPSVPFDFMQGGYALWNATVQHQLTDNWRVSLNINNVLDKVYYQQLGSTFNGNWYGEPRNVVLTVRGHW